MKKRCFLLTLCAVLPLLLSPLLVSCEPPANTAIADRADKHVTADFTTLYPVREWGSDDTETPTFQTFLITDEETLNTLFTSLPEGITVDFEHEMLVVYTYSAIYVRDLHVRTIFSNSSFEGLKYPMVSPNLLTSESFSSTVSER